MWRVAHTSISLLAVVVSVAAVVYAVQVHKRSERLEDRVDDIARCIPRLTDLVYEVRGAVGRGDIGDDANDALFSGPPVSPQCARVLFIGR